MAPLDPYRTGRYQTLTVCLCLVAIEFVKRQIQREVNIETRREGERATTRERDREKGRRGTK